MTKEQARVAAADLARATIARSFGIRHARMALQEARRAGIGPALALAIVEKESGGRNVFGHDRGSDGRYIFPARDGVVPVTEGLYREYKRRRDVGGNGRGGMQGVGPMQLTWWTTQDAADKLGGCWRPRYNLRMGFHVLRANIDGHGLPDGIRRYNGSGPAAEAYALDVLKRRAKWRRRLFTKG